MNPVHFPEETNVLAKNQPQYRTLPVCIMQEKPGDPDSTIRFTCKYELSDIELQQIIKTRCVYISQFGDGFHPIYPQIDSPFLVMPVDYKSRGNRCYDLWFPLDDTEKTGIMNVRLEDVIETMMQATGLNADQFLFNEMPAMAISKTGDLEEL